MKFFTKIRDIHPGEISERLFVEMSSASMHSLWDIIEPCVKLPKECWGAEVSLTIALDCIVPKERVDD